MAAAVMTAMICTNGNGASYDGMFVNAKTVAKMEKESYPDDQSFFVDKRRSL